MDPRERVDFVGLLQQIPSAGEGEPLVPDGWKPELQQPAIGFFLNLPFYERSVYLSLLKPEQLEKILQTWPIRNRQAKTALATSMHYLPQTEELAIPVVEFAVSVIKDNSMDLRLRMRAAALYGTGYKVEKFDEEITGFIKDCDSRFNVYRSGLPDDPQRAASVLADAVEFELLHSIYDNEVFNRYRLPGIKAVTDHWKKEVSQAEAGDLRALKRCWQIGRYLSGDSDEYTKALVPGEWLGYAGWAKGDKTSFPDYNPGFPVKRPFEFDKVVEATFKKLAESSLEAAEREAMEEEIVTFLREINSSNNLYFPELITATLKRDDFSSGREYDPLAVDFLRLIHNAIVSRVPGRKSLQRLADFIRKKKVSQIYLLSHPISSGIAEGSSTAKIYTIAVANRSPEKLREGKIESFYVEEIEDEEGRVIPRICFDGLSYRSPDYLASYLGQRESFKSWDELTQELEQAVKRDLTEEDYSLIGEYLIALERRLVEEMGYPEEAIPLISALMEKITHYISNHQLLPIAIGLYHVSPPESPDGTEKTAADNFVRQMETAMADISFCGYRYLAELKRFAGCCLYSPNIDDLKEGAISSIEEIEKSMQEDQSGDKHLEYLHLEAIRTILNGGSIWQWYPNDKDEFFNRYGKLLTQIESRYGELLTGFTSGDDSFEIIRALIDNWESFGAIGQTIIAEGRFRRIRRYIQDFAKLLGKDEVLELASYSRLVSIFGENRAAVLFHMILNQAKRDSNAEELQAAIEILLSDALAEGGLDVYPTLINLKEIVSALTGENVYLARIGDPARRQIAVVRYDGEIAEKDWLWPFPWREGMEVVLPGEYLLDPYQLDPRLPQRENLRRAIKAAAEKPEEARRWIDTIDRDQELLAIFCDRTRPLPTLTPARQIENLPRLLLFSFDHRKAKRSEYPFVRFYSHNFKLRGVVYLHPDLPEFSFMVTERGLESDLVSYLDPSSLSYLERAIYYHLREETVNPLKLFQRWARRMEGKSPIKGMGRARPGNPVSYEPRDEPPVEDDQRNAVFADGEEFETQLRVIADMLPYSESNVRDFRGLSGGGAFLVISASAGSFNDWRQAVPEETVIKILAETPSQVVYIIRPVDFNNADEVRLPSKTRVEIGEQRGDNGAGFLGLETHRIKKYTPDELRILAEGGAKEEDRLVFLPADYIEDRDGKEVKRTFRPTFENCRHAWAWGRNIYKIFAVTAGVTGAEFDTHIGYMTFRPPKPFSPSEWEVIKQRRSAGG